MDSYGDRLRLGVYRMLKIDLISKQHLQSPWSKSDQSLEGFRQNIETDTQRVSPRIVFRVQDHLRQWLLRGNPKRQAENRSVRGAGAYGPLQIR